MTARRPVYLVKGSDPVLLGGAVSTLLDQLVAGGDRSLLVHEFDLDSTKLAAALGAAQTIPFLTDYRIVVVRRFGRYSKGDDVAPVVAYLEDALPSTTLVLVGERTALTSANDDGEPFTKTPKMPPALVKAVTAAGEVIETDAASRNMSGWVGDQFAAAGLDIEPAVRDKVVKTIGEDGGAVVGIIERLKGAFAPGERLRLADVEAFIGPPGGVPPWDLTDAIDKGDVPLALDRLQRMMGAGDRHSLAIMATLQSHVLRMVKLDGANVRSEKDAAALLGMKGSTFPAKKAMNQARKLGSPGVRRALALLAKADVDLRGAQAWPQELTMEVLVARLARNSR
ncbi:MAG: holA [Ilumatobacteraceae bacterium]|nr:holA [Ilumatobacteraceae bacterium]